MRCLLRLASNPTSLDNQGGDPNEAFLDDGVLTRFDDYELIAEIARGGMGIVYRARQLSLGRMVAVKMILAGQLATPESVRRFQFEAEAGAKLDHPGIVPIYEVGEANAQHYFSMKLIDGPNLAHSIASFQPAADMRPTELRGRQRKIARLMIDVAHAIAYAHEHGVMHRDLKPTNILLDQEGKPHLTDFGLAKLTGTDDQTTRTATVLGSPAYMAPEQAMGDSANVTTSVDIYGIGAVLYELLTGRPPFAGKTAFETLEAVVKAEPVPPRSANPRLDQDLQTIALKCLEKDPAARYASAKDVSSELTRFLEGRPILARPVNSLVRVQRWCRRKPAISSLLAALMLVTLVGFVGIISQWQTAIMERTRANINAAQATRERDAARRQTYRSSIALAASALQLHQMDTAGAALQNAPTEYRNWEWNYFSSKIDVPSKLCASRLQGAPSALWFSPDGGQLACTRGDEFEGSTHTNTIWDTESGKTILELDAESILSPDLRRMATSDGESVVITNRATGDQVEFDHQQPLNHLVGFSQSGNILVTRSKAGMYAWETKNGQKKFEFLGSLDAYYGPRILEFGERHYLYQGGREMPGFDTQTNSPLESHIFDGSEIHTVACHTQTGLMATAGEFPDNEAKLWNATTGDLLATLKGHRNVVYRIAFSEDGTLLATGSLDASVRVWDTATRDLKLVLKGHTDTILDIAFAQRHQLLATSSADRTARLWSLETGDQIVALPADTVVNKVAIHPDGRSVATADESGNVSLWTIDNRMRERLTGHTGFVYGIDHHPDGLRIASAGWDKTVRIWDETTGAQLASLETPNIVHGVRFSHDGELFACTSPTQLAIVQTESMETIRVIDTQTYNMGTKAGTRAGFDMDGKLIAAAMANTPFVCDVETGNRIANLKEHDGIVTDCAFVALRNQWITIGGHQIRFHDAEDYSVAGELTVTGQLMSMAFNSDYSRFCVATDRNMVHVYDLTAETPQKLTVLAHPSTAYSMAFSHDNSRIFVGCHDSTIRLWNPETGLQIAVLQGHADYVHGISMNPVGSALVSGSGDFSLRIWRN